MFLKFKAHNWEIMFLHILGQVSSLIFPPPLPGYSYWKGSKKVLAELIGKCVSLWDYVFSNTLQQIIQQYIR